MKILLLDIETSLNKCWTFSLFKAYIPPKQIIEPQRVLCWAAKWLGDDTVFYRNWNHKDHITKIHELLDKADAVIHFNGKAFDVKHLNREFLLNEMEPPSPFSDIDLLQTVRKRFKFPSNKLEWVTVELGYEGKIQNRGVQLWIDCQEGKRAAWQEMKEYNIRDITELEPIYFRLLPWIQSHPNYGHWVEVCDQDDRVCSKCGSTNIRKNGLERRTLVPYQRYRCKDCGSPLKGRIKVSNTPKPTTRAA